MRVAALADIHGNLPALEAALDEIEREQPDLVVCCGDVASGPMPAETIDRLRAMTRMRFVRGNADRGLIEEFDGKPLPPMPGPFTDWCAKQINREQRDFLASFEDSITVDSVDGIGRVLFCHATPRNDTDVFTVETPFERVRSLMDGVDADLVICGHTHMQFDRRVDQLRLINAGSIGMPYVKPGAYWAMLGPDARLKRTDYDREKAAQRIRRLSWANAIQFAEQNVLAAPTLDDAMAFMRKTEASQAE